MADAAQTQRTSVENVTKRISKLIDSSLTECPICFECFQNPKSLPCLHTFCQQCLETYIEQQEQTAKQTSTTMAAFPCPICRRITPPIDATDQLEQWARKFPTNNLVLAMIKISDLQVPDKPCVPCQRKQVESIATLWCKNCDIYICNKCEEMHALFFTTHTVIPMTDIMQSPAQIVDLSAKCEQHKEVSRLFCVDHERLCCTTCIVLDHRKCSKVISASEHVKVLSENKEIVKLQQTFSAGIQTVEDLIVHSCNNLEEATRANDNLTTTRTKVDKLLNALEYNARDEIQKYTKEEKQKVERKVESMKRLKGAMQQSSKMLDAAVTFGDDSMIIAQVMVKSRECDTLHNQIEKIKRKTQSKGTKISNFEWTERISKISEMIECPHLFRKIPGKLSKAHRVSNFDTVETKCRIRGLLYLANSRIIVVNEHDKSICYYDEEGVDVCKVKVNGRPWDICRVNYNTVAVSVYRPSSILLLDVTLDSVSITSTITLDKMPFGIVHQDSNFYVTCSQERPPCLCKLKSNGALLKTMNGISLAWHITCFKGSRKDLLITRRTKNVGENTVYTKHNDAEPVPLMKVGTVKGARGVDTDEYDNVYVCGTDSSNIVMLTSDGEEICLLSAEKDGLTAPCAISVLGDKFVIAEENSTKITIYQLK